MFSVLMSVYSGDKVDSLNLCLSSIFSQSENIDQLVLVVDGPISCEMDSVLLDWCSKKKCIDLLRLDDNGGLANALNIGLEYCRNELVFRMDSDDIVINNRFLIQLNYMLNNPDVGILGGGVIEFDERGSEKYRSVPVGNEIKRTIGFRNPLCHPTVVFRKSIIKSIGGYPDNYPEDWLMWARCFSSGVKIENLNIPLVKMRVGKDFISRRGARFLKGEIVAFLEFRNLGLLTGLKFYESVIIRCILRLSPSFIRLFLYKYAR